MSHIACMLFESIMVKIQRKFYSDVRNCMKHTDLMPHLVLELFSMPTTTGRKVQLHLKALRGQLLYYQLG